MRFEFILITIVTLAVLAACTPLQTMPNATRIPLSNRGLFIKDDGSFDPDGAMEHIAHIENKYRQNRINFMRNVDREAFNDSADIELPAFPVRLQKPKAESIRLTNHNDRIWTADITIGSARPGTPAQVFAVSIDTGHADLWVPSLNCLGGCDNKNKYNPEDSDSSIRKGGIKTLDSSPGKLVGEIYTDTVQVGGVKVYVQYFVNAGWMSTLFNTVPYDGALGMAYQGLSYIQQLPFFNAAIRNMAVPKDVFALALGKTDSELCLGGINKSKYRGGIEYHNVVSSDGDWKIGGASAILNETVAVGGFKTIIDSGSAFILGPSKDVEDVFSKISDSKRGTGNFYQYPCDRPPDFKISWGGTWWSVPAEDFWNGRKGTGSDMCISTVAGSDFLKGNTWILGTPFMKNVYTVFDFKDNAVGFALRNVIDGVDLDCHVEEMPALPV